MFLHDNSGNDLSLDGKLAQPLQQRLIMLLCKNGCRSQDRHLLARHDRLESSPQCYFGLAVSDIPTNEPVHYDRTFHIVLDILDTGKLVLGFLEWEGSFEFELPIGVLGIWIAFAAFPSGIQLYQPSRQLLRGLPGFGFFCFPTLATQFVKPGSSSLAADVPLDQVGLFDRNKKCFVVRIGNLDIVAFFSRHGDPVDLEEFSDTVVHVHDMVAFIEVYKRIERRGLDLVQCLYNLFAPSEYLVVAYCHQFLAAY